VDRVALLVVAALALGPSHLQADDSHFDHVKEQTAENIAVLGTKSVSEAQFNRAYADISRAVNAFDPRIRKGLLASGAKLIIAGDEEELVEEIDFYQTLFPLEAIFTNIDGTDETLPGVIGVSGSRLELMYLVVYYALLTDHGLETICSELTDAYDEAQAGGLFRPGEAYEDGVVDEIHLDASSRNALKYGSYLFGLYALYFGNGTSQPSEFSISTRDQLATSNPRGFDFVASYLDN
jgi:hypothetical protein